MAAVRALPRRQREVMTLRVFFDLDTEATATLLGISRTHAYELVARGLVLIPEARQLWPGMTVRENLDLGAYCRSARKERSRTLQEPDRQSSGRP